MNGRGWMAVAAVAGLLGCGSGRARVDPTSSAQGRLRWIAQVGGPGSQAIPGWWNVGTDRAGNTSALVVTQQVSPDVPSSTLELRRFDASGTPLGARSWTYGGTMLDATPDFFVAVAPDGDVLVAVKLNCIGPTCPEPIDFGAGPVVRDALVRLDASGALRWQRALTGTPDALAVDREGAATVLEFLLAGLRTIVERVDPRGELLWSRFEEAATCASDEDGNVACASDTWDPSPVLHVRKLAASDGRVLWSRDVAGPSFPTSIVASGGGVAIIASGPASGTLRFGRTTVAATPIMALALDPEGDPRWAAAVEARLVARVAIGPSGRTWVAGEVPGCPAIRVRAYAPLGELLWSRSLGVDAPCPELPQFAAIGGVAVAANDAVTITGYYAGPLEVGGTVLESDDVDAFVAVLGD